MGTSGSAAHSMPNRSFSKAMASLYEIPCNDVTAVTMSPPLLQEKQYQSFFSGSILTHWPLFELWTGSCPLLKPLPFACRVFPDS